MTIQLKVVVHLDLPIPTTHVNEFVIALAKEHGITYKKTEGDAFADTVTRLSGDDVAPDEIENLLVALKQAHVISGSDMVALLGNYFDEINSTK